MNRLVAAALAGIAVGAAGGLAVAPVAAGAAGANCSSISSVDGITAEHPHYSDGGVGSGWVGQGCKSVQAANGNSGSNKCAPCQSPTLSGMESECLKQWKVGYCQ